MKQRLVKILPLVLFGLGMVFLGAFITGQAFAVVSPLVCGGEEVAGFSGWLMCRIGDPVNGITGAATLFDGQRILAQKIDAIVKGENPMVYMVKGDASPANAILLGRLQSNILADFDAANSPLNFFDPHSSTAQADLTPDATASRMVRAFFVPTSDYSITRSGVKFKPSTCQVVMGMGANGSVSGTDGIKQVNAIGIQCSYSPVLCQAPDGNSAITTYGCLSTTQRMIFRQDYTSATPKTDRYSIIIVNQ